MRRGQAHVRSGHARLAALTIALLASLVLAGWGPPPKPSGIPFRWELEFEPGPLRMYVDPAASETYWYFTYKITNLTGRDQLWAPSVDLFTDAGEIMGSGKGVPVRVAGDIRALLRNPLLELQNEIIGEIFQGEENAREGLVVWPARQTSVNEISLFLAGLSGETARVRNPVTGKDVILRKTRQRDYLIRGDATARRSKPVELVDEAWVMR